MNRIPIICELSESIISFIFAIAILFALPYLLRYIKGRDIIVYLVCVCVYYIGYKTAYSETVKQYLEDNASTILLQLVPLYFVGLAIRKERLIYILHNVSIISVFADLIFCLFFLKTYVNLSEGSMGFSYYILPHVSFVTIFALEHHRKIDTISSLLGIGILLGLGSRGPILSLAICVIAYIIFFEKAISSKKIKRFLFIEALVLIVTLFWNYILLALSDIFSHLNLSTRVIEILQAKEFIFDNGRNEISMIIWNRILDNSMRGYGIASDRAFVAAWSHNIVFELWISYGVVVGSILFLRLLLLYLMGWIKCDSKEIKLFYLVLISGMGFMTLLISSSYLREANFYLLIGLCVGVIRGKGQRIRFII